MIASFYSPDDLVALWISLKLATVTVALLLLLCTPLAWWLATTRSRLRVVGEAMAALAAGAATDRAGLLSAAVSRAVRLGRQVDASPGTATAELQLWRPGHRLDAVFDAVRHTAVAGCVPGGRRARTRGCRDAACPPWDRFFTVAVPLARRGFITGSVLAFAHTLGEFGVVLMLGGNIPGRTQTASIVIFNHVEALDYSGAQRLSITLLVACFILLLIVYGANRSRAEVAAVA
jgi:molybdate transport system permease protein